MAGPHSSKQIYRFKSLLARINIKPLCHSIAVAAIPLKQRPPIRENFNFWSLHSSACSLHASAGMIRRWMVRMQKKIVLFDSSIQIFYLHFFAIGRTALFQTNLDTDLNPYWPGSTSNRCAIQLQLQQFHWNSGPQSEKISTFGHCIRVLAACMLPPVWFVDEWCTECRKRSCLLTLLFNFFAFFCHWQDRTLPNKSTDLNPHWPGSTSNRCARKFLFAAIPLKQRPPIRRNFNFWSLHSSVCSLHASAGMIRRWMVHRMQKKTVPFDSSIQIFYLHFLPLAGPHPSKQIYRFKSLLARIYIKPLCHSIAVAAIPLKQRPPIRENFNFWSLHSSACSLHASAGMIQRWMVHRMQKKIVPFDSSIQIVYLHFFALAGPHSSKQIYRFKSSLAGIYIKPLCQKIAVGSICIETAAPNPRKFELLVTAFKCLQLACFRRYDSEMNGAPNAEKDRAFWLFYSNFLFACNLPLAGRHSSKQIYRFKSSLARIYIKPLCYSIAVGSISIEKAAPNQKKFQLLVTAFKCLQLACFRRYDSEMNGAPNAEKDRAFWLFYSNFLFAFFAIGRTAPFQTNLQI